MGHDAEAALGDDLAPHDLVGLGRVLAGETFRLRQVSFLRTYVAELTPSGRRRSRTPVYHWRWWCRSTRIHQNGREVQRTFSDILSPVPILNVIVGADDEFIERIAAATLRFRQIAISTKRSVRLGPCLS